MPFHINALVKPSAAATASVLALWNPYGGRHHGRAVIPKTCSIHASLRSSSVRTAVSDSFLRSGWL